MKRIDGICAAKRWTAELLQDARDLNQVYLEELCLRSLEKGEVISTNKKPVRVLEMVEGKQPKNHPLRFGNPGEYSSSKSRSAWSFKPSGKLFSREITSR